MTKHDYIRKTAKDSYQIKITRMIDNKRVIVIETYLSLDDSIAQRDAILAHFESTGKLEHLTSKLERRRMNAVVRFGTDDIVMLQVADTQDRYMFVKRMTCEDCGTDISRSHYFMKAKKCIKCSNVRDSEHQKKVVDARNRRQLCNKNNSLGVKNISHNKFNDFYEVSIERNGERFRAAVRSLNEAIRIKEDALSFFKEYGRLPIAEYAR